MNTRYIQRVRLSARQYTAGCPVVLAAGALLEDIHQPRLVAQLKFKSLSDKPIAAVTVRCSAGTETLHTYGGLAVKRGQSFGQYTAIPLPLSDAQRLRVSVESVTFADGTDWTVPADAQWGVLPPFRALEEPLAAFAGEHLPDGRYACAAPADLWYCACGGVNRDGETVCHRCGAEREQVFQYADPAGALYQRRQEEAARRAAEQEVLRLAEAVRQAEEREAKAAALKAAAAEKAARLKETAAKLGGKKKWLALGGGAAALVLAAVLLVPRLTGGSPSITIPGSDGASDVKLPPVQEILQPEKLPVIDLPGTGTMNIDLAVGDNGRCPVRSTLIREFLPEVQTIDFQYLPPSGLGTDIDDYLTHSFKMSTLMRGDSASEVWGDFDPDQTEATFCLLLFDADTHLMGYFLGRPETLDNGLQRFAVTLCDYDFTALYEREKAAFDADKEALYAKRIPLEDVYTCGAAYYLRGIDSSNRHDETSQDDHLMYQLWDQMGSPYLDRWARPMERFVEENHSYGNFHEDLWRFFILLDENKQYLGYVIQNGGEEIPDAPGAPSQETPTSGTVNIDVPYTDSEKCKVTPELVQQVIPQAKFISFMGTPDLGDNIDGYLADSFQMAIRMIGEDAGGEWGSFDPKGDAKSTFCLLVFDGSTHLAGYFVGVPKKVDGSTWRLEVTLCDYDFSSLVQKQKAAFEVELDALCANYIPLADVKSSGAKYCLEGWYTGRSADLRDDPIQAYHMWNQLNSPQVEKYARDLDRIDRRQEREGRYVGFLLLDKNYQLIGYTMKGGDESSVPEEPTEESTQQAPTSGTVNIDVPYTDSEKCKVTPELVQQVIPHAKFISFMGTPDLGDNIDGYLADSFQVAIRMEGGDANGEWDSFDPKGDSKSTFCLLVFDGSTHLAGYFVGVPKKVDGSTWRLEVTLCDYDFSSLVQKQKAAFEAELDALCANYIPLADVKSSGAKYCLEGWYTGRSADLREDPIQAYHMWNQLNSPQVEKYARDLERLERRKIREGRYVGFLLLDKNYQLIGYTMKG